MPTSCALCDTPIANNDPQNPSILCSACASTLDQRMTRTRDLAEAPCPICDTPTAIFDARFPSVVCSRCASRAVDSDGNATSFSNAGIGGGIRSHHTQSDNTTRQSDDTVVFIDGHKAHGVEFHMGGIGIVLGESSDE